MVRLGQSVITSHLSCEATYIHHTTVVVSYSSTSMHFMGVCVCISLHCFPKVMLLISLLLLMLHMNIVNWYIYSAIVLHEPMLRYRHIPWLICVYIFVYVWHTAQAAIVYHQLTYSYPKILVVIVYCILCSKWNMRI